MIINLTPHALNIRQRDGSFVTVPPSGTVARVAEERYECSDRHDIPGVRISIPTYGKLEGLPERQEGVVYVVSAICLQALPPRRHLDCFSPGPAIRDEAGRIIGCDGLSAHRRLAKGTLY